MKTMEAVNKGISLVLRNAKMIPIIYAINLVLALTVAIPLYSTLAKSTNDKGVREQLRMGFDYTWWSEFYHEAHHIEKTVRPSLTGGFGPLFDNLEILLTGKVRQFGSWILLLGVGYLLLTAFLNGGVIGIYADEKRSFTVSRFFSNSGFYFHHFFALLLTAVLVYFAVYKFLSPAVFGLIDQLSSSWMSQKSVWYLNLFGYVILVLVIIFVNMVFDYAKIIVVAEGKASSWLCIWLAVKFIFKHFLGATGLYFLLAGIALLLVLVFGFLLNSIHPSGIATIILVMLFQQTFMLAKIWARLNFYGGQCVFYTNQPREERRLKKV
ncbi:hypothetical protein A2V82_14775 [candidate division KSB1 bacterium RBG_16_48_16]|nr:MAG: hypothetical protein A2V82_14775 [candidate division KSB1 bacterium RBG_16_48_16]